MNLRIAVLLFTAGTFAPLWGSPSPEGSGSPSERVAPTSSDSSRKIVALLRGSGPQAVKEAGPATAEAIKALGLNASAKQVGGIVFAATRAVPDAVLEIVHWAVLASPNNFAAEIVTAAISAVPNPAREVVYRRLVSRPVRGERDFKELGDFKEGDFKSPIPDPGTRMTLAEAIVQTALDARGDLDPGALQAAADLALIGSPDYLLQAMNDPHGSSAVGDVGNSNYGNEPVLAPSPPPIPPVSP